MDSRNCCAVYIDDRVKLERWIRKEGVHPLETSASEPSLPSLLAESAELRENVELFLEVFKQGNVFVEDLLFIRKLRCKRLMNFDTIAYLQYTYVIRGNRLPAN